MYSNDCILYRGEKYKNLDKWLQCKAPRYKEGPSNNGTKMRGGPVKVVWYFPIVLQSKQMKPGNKPVIMLSQNGRSAIGSDHCKANLVTPYIN